MAKMRTKYLAMRDGRPRWVPGPGVRGRGFKGQDLRYPPGHERAGDWMDEQDAHRAARALNDQTTGGVRKPMPAPLEVRTVSALFDRLRASPKFANRDDAEEGAAVSSRVGVEKLRLSPRTKMDYLAHLKTLETWCGDIQAADLTPALVEEFYHDLAEHRGLASANAIMRVFKLAMNFGLKKLRWLTFNPVTGVEMASPDGRLVMWEPAEFAAMLGAAAWCGLPSIGDAFVLGALTGQRRTDILLLPEGEMAQGYYVVQQRKRGAKAFVPITRPLLARVEDMRRRKADNWPDVHHTLELVNSRSGKPYHHDGNLFGDQWRMVRAAASGDAAAITRGWLEANGHGPHPAITFVPTPEAAGKFFSDLRDTAVTLLFMAACSVAEIANITGHSLKTVETILNKHYFNRNAALAKSAGAKLDAYLETSDIRWA